MKKLTTLSTVLAVASALILGGVAVHVVGAQTSPEGASGARGVPPARPDPGSCRPIPGHLDVGLEFEGMIAQTSRSCETPGLLPDHAVPTSNNMDAVLYGTCEPPQGEGGCDPPLQIQTFGACERNRSLYTRYPGPDGPRRYQAITVRGVPAALFDDGNGVMLEIYTAKVTTVIFADSEEIARRVGEELRGRLDSRGIAAREALPQPAKGALEGELSCG